jgi:DNA (cytosine-5)-methyltransferase 1
VNELSLFTGAGGGLLGTHLLGWRPVGYVEWNEYCQRVIAARIADGYLPVAPIFTDVREFVQSGAAEQYRGVADVVTAGFPCQPFSSAGIGLGERDPKNMWPATRDVIRIVRPRYLLLENVTGLLGRYASTVTADLAAMGYVGSNGVLSAADEGANHIRERVWFRCNANANSQPNGSVHDEAPRRSPNVSDAKRGRKPLGRNLAGTWWSGELAQKYDRRTGANPSRGMGVDDGLAHRMDRLAALGNGQVPAVVARAWEELAA